MSRLPVEQLNARLNTINLAGTEVHHLPDWKGYDDPRRLQIIRQIAMMRGRDPRIAGLAVDIIKRSGAKPREYKKQAAALLKWVQNPKNIYYVNEPGERLQDPVYTIRVGYGDCDDQVITLCSLFESVRLSWKLVLAGMCGKRKVRYIEGNAYPKGCQWAHIYCMVGVPAFRPSDWYFCETTIDGVPLGWDVISGDKSYLPELDKPHLGLPRIMRAPKRQPLARRAALPPVERRSPAYAMAHGRMPARRGGFVPSGAGDFVPAYGQASTLVPAAAVAVGASVATSMRDPTAKGRLGDALKLEKLIPPILTGVIIATVTSLLVKWLEPKVGLKAVKE